MNHNEKSISMQESYNEFLTAIIILLANIPLFLLIIILIKPSMMETAGLQFSGIFETFWFYIPLGVIGAWRWGSWSLKKLFALTYKPIESSTNSINETTLGIVTPVYYEDKKIFKRALDSWAANNPDELIAVITQNDTDSIDVFRKFSQNKPWAQLIILPENGKRSALVSGLLKSKSQIIGLVDCDTIWAPNIREKVLAPFSSPQIGGVTVKCHPISRNSIWEKMTDIFWDTRNYLDLPAQTAMGNALSCLSGRTSFYRRNLVMDKLDFFTNEKIFGVRKESGEDKCLTRLIQKEGWKTYYQNNAVIFSEAASDFKTFLSQKIRWSRNSHNSDLIFLSKDGALKHHPELAWFMIDRLISVFTIFLGPIFFAFSIYLGDWKLSLAIIALWFVGRGIRIFPHIRRHPEDWYLLPVYIGVHFLTGLAKLYALVTLKDQLWIRKRFNEQNQKVKLQKKVLDISKVGSILTVLVLLVFLRI